MSLPAIPMTFDGETFRPSRGFLRIAEIHYAVGETVPMVAHEDRSGPSHRHYFVAVNEAWSNLPEELTPRFPTSEHLRKHCLIRAGYRDERSIVCSSKAEARRIAAFMRPVDEYAVVIVRDAVVIHYTAKSQSMKAMGKRVFQESKDAVLGLLAEMLGVTVADLQRAEAAA